MPLIALLMALVQDEPIRVLYVDQLPRFEFQFLSPFLTKDESFRTHVYLASAEKEWTQPASPGLDPLTRSEVAAILSNPDRLAQYQVVIWGDLKPSHRVDIKGVEPLRKYVDAGGALLFIAGHGYLRSEHPGDLRTLLPIHLDAWTQPSSDPAFEKLIGELGHDTFQIRQAAMARLRDAGRAALFDLRKASESKHLEIRQRAIELIKSIEDVSGACDPTRLRLTAEGKKHPAMRLTDAPWDRAPDIRWRTDGLKLKEGATTIVESSTGDPIFIVRGKIAYLATGDWYRWRTSADDYRDTYRSLLRWLSSR